MQTPTGRRAAGRAAQRGGSHTARKRRSRFRRPMTAAGVVFAVSLLACIALFIIKGRYVNTPNEEALAQTLQSGAFAQGITVNGTDVGGLTLEAARAQLLPLVEAELETLNIRVVHGSTLWVLGAADVGARSTLDAVLDEAMLLGRDGTKAENAEALADLEANGKAYTAGFISTRNALGGAVEKIAAGMGAQPVEPYAEPDPWAAEPTFVYHEGVDGHVLDTDALMDSINEALAQNRYDLTLTPELVTTPPAHDLSWIKENTQLRAYWQTDFGTSSSLRTTNRVGNIQKASTLLNGASVAVGEEFNFNAFIGPRTEAGGWPLAPGIVNGNTYEMQAGGGICQVSTTLYNALLCAGSDIAITERYHHSWPSSYADKGLDATVTGSAESGKSLNFINNTGAPLYIFAYCDQENRKMNIYLYGEPLPAGTSYKTRGEVTETIEPGETVYTDNPDWPAGYEETTVSARKGYKADAFRDEYRNGEFVNGEFLYTDSYRAVAAQVTRGTGDPSLPKPEKEK